MRRICTTLLATAALAVPAVTPSPVRAQALTPPGAPEYTLRLGNDLARVFDSYTFSGCASGPIAPEAFGTPFCVAGRLTRGFRLDGTPFNVMAFNTSSPSSIRVYYDYPNRMEIGGIYYTNIVGGAGANYIFTSEDTRTPQSFTPSGVLLLMNYDYVPSTAVGGSSAFVTADLVPSAVPEPATLALVGAGVVAMGAIARRRRA